jgi:hypothetical protein
MSQMGHDLPSSADPTSSVVLSNPEIHQSAAYGGDEPNTAIRCRRSPHTHNPASNIRALAKSDKLAGNAVEASHRTARRYPPAPARHGVSFNDQKENFTIDASINDHAVLIAEQV